MSNKAKTFKAATREEILSFNVPKLRQYAVQGKINLQGRDSRKDIQETILAHHGYELAADNTTSQTANAEGEGKMAAIAAAADQANAENGASAERTTETEAAAAPAAAEAGEPETQPATNDEANAQESVTIKKAKTKAQAAEEKRIVQRNPNEVFTQAI